MKTSEKIVKSRTNLNLTQDQLAEIMQVSRQTISKWELDISIPETSKLLKLSQTLGISIDYLLNETENNECIKIPIKHSTSGFQPDWTALYPVLEEYENKIDCEYYYRIFDNIFDEISSKYNYTLENSMLVAKDMLSKTYFKRL